MNDSTAPRPRGPASARGFTVFAVLGIAGLVGLGTWQVQRLQWKEGLIAQRKAVFALPPLAITGEPVQADAAAWRRVTLRGRWLHDREILVGPRVHRGLPGWHVVTPLRRPDGRIVLVDRGWVPEDRKDPARRPGSQPTGETTVEGIVGRPSPHGLFAPDNDPSRNQWFRMDPAAMAARLSLSGVAPWWVSVLATGRDTGYPIGTAGLVLPDNNHLGYAITWYALAAALAVIAVIYCRPSRRTDGT